MEPRNSLLGVFEARGIGPEFSELAADLVLEACSTYPTISCDPLEFGQRLIEAASHTGQATELSSLRVSDLWLAFGCSLKDKAAMTLFDLRFRGDFETVYRRVGSRGVDQDDFVQLAREKLFARNPPKIAEYSGKGDLRHWLRVMLTRTLLDMSRKRREDVQPNADCAQGFQLPSPGRDPELDFMQAHYKQAFHSAFERAAAALDTEDRNLLRQHFVHGLGIDQLSALLGVHRATAARRITRARAALTSRTREELMQGLHLNASELDSVMRFVESQVHVTLERVLGPPLEE